jgi:hypothetical protein
MTYRSRRLNAACTACSAHFNWFGWLFAGLLLAQNAAPGQAAPASSNPLEGRLLEHSNGNFFVYHDGVKFTVQPANTGDQVIEAIPTASETQWSSFFTSTVPPAQSASGQPAAFPAS